MAYVRGDYTVVYPVVRGLGPLVTVFAAGFVFHESFEPLQWGGVLLLTGGIFALGAVNLRDAKGNRKRLRQALGFAVVTGIFVAMYTTYDAYGIRQTANTFTFIFWYFFFDGVVYPWVAAARWRRMENPPEIRPLLIRGWVGAIVAYFSFGSIMLATRLDTVGEAAVMRETSVVFAGLIGWLFLKERVGPLRALLMAVIAGGAVLVEFGG